MASLNLLILGAGFSGVRIARAALAHGQVTGTRRTAEGCAELERQGIRALRFDGDADADPESLSDPLARALEACTHLLISVAPARSEPLHDSALDRVRRHLEQRAGTLAALQWMGYLSTIGVYGDHEGRWVDERSACRSRQVRSRMRLAAEQGWQALAAERAVPIAVLRLSGIYGPGRNAVADALRGRARRLIKPGQVFNRIHVDDVAQATLLAMRQQADGVFNITDDRPAAPQDVVEHAHRLTGKDLPPAIAFEQADLSPMARSFYSENKRVSNQRSKAVLGLQYTYPDYERGLQALLPIDTAEALNDSSTG